MTLDPIGSGESIWPSDQWRLTSLRRGRIVDFPPCAPELVSFHALHEGLAPVVVLGEEGSGLRSFFRWLKDNLQDDVSTPVLVNLASSAGRTAEATACARLEEVLGPRWSEKNDRLVDRLDAIRDQPVTVVFTGITEANFLSHATEELLASIRGARETGSLGQARFIFGARDEHLFASGEFSVFLEVSNVYKLSEWTHSDVELALQQAGIDGGEALAPRLVEGVGGHPLMTKMLIERLRPGSRDLDAEITRLINGPPSAAKRWHERLERALEQRRTLRGNFERHLYGGDRAAPESGDLPLYIMGWLGPVGSRWGLRSEVHRTWARYSRDGMAW